MGYRVGPLTFPSWESIEIRPGCYTNTFIFKLSSNDGLPPGDYARLLRRLFPVLTKLHRGTASLWVQVESPGLWYPRELRRSLYGASLPVAVTRTGRTLRLVDFQSVPWSDRVPPPPPPEVDDWQSGLSAPTNSLPTNSLPCLACLRALARISSGFTTEIASLAGVSVSSAREHLLDLRAAEYVRHVIPGKTAEKQQYSDKYPYWRITRPGLSATLRSWGLPPGLPFTERRESRLDTRGRHRTVGRQWPAWLRRDLREAEIWTGWSEVAIQGLRAIPDGLAWGQMEGHEVLFWLEVESGHQAGREIMEKIARRFRAAVRYAQQMNVRLVFALLAMPWVQNAARMAFMDMPGTAAVVLGDWKEFGRLPPIQWGRVRQSGG